MGAGQTYQWAVSFPDMVPARLPVLRVVEDQRAQHRVPRGRQGGADRRRRRSTTAGTTRSRARGCARLARVYAGWGFSQAFYWDAVYTEMGFRRSRTSSSGSGRASSSTTATRTTCSRCCGRGSTGNIGADARLRRRPGQGAAVDQGQGDRHARREGPLLPARGRGVRGRSTSRTGSCASSPACGATSPAAARTRWTRSSSIGGCATCWRTEPAAAQGAGMAGVAAAGSAVPSALVPPSLCSRSSSRPRTGGCPSWPSSAESRPNSRPTVQSDQPRARGRCRASAPGGRCGRGTRPGSRASVMPSVSPTAL